MKRLLPLIGLLFLAGCAAHAQVSSWGTPYVTDDTKVTLTETALRDCVQRAIDTTYYGLDRTRTEIQGCYEDYTKESKIPGTDTYYFWHGQEKDGDSPYQDFSTCISQHATSIGEFGPDDTVYAYRNDLRKCLTRFPGYSYTQVMDDSPRLLKQGDEFHALMMGRGQDIYLDCRWYPTATGYAEDADCSPAK